MSERCPVELHAHHVGIFCKDIDASINWWRENFGFKLRRRVVLPLPDGGISNMCQVRAGGVYLELYGYPDIPQQTEENFWSTLGTKHVCFAPRNCSLDEVRQYLDVRGISYELSCETPIGPDGAPIRSLWFYDPSGTRIQIIEEFYPGGDFAYTEQELFRTTARDPDIPQIIFHHIAKYCSDLNASIQWYNVALGLECVWQGVSRGNEGESHNCAFLRGAGYYIELHEKPYAPQPKEAYWGTLGTKHISLYTDESDMPKLIAYLKSLGTQFTVEHHWDEEYNHIPGGYTVAFFPDLDGTTIEINGTFFPGEGLYPGENIFDD